MTTPPGGQLDHFAGAIPIAACSPGCLAAGNMVMQDHTLLLALETPMGLLLAKLLVWGVADATVMQTEPLDWLGSGKTTGMSLDPLLQVLTACLGAVECGADAWQGRIVCMSRVSGARRVRVGCTLSAQTHAAVHAMFSCMLPCVCASCVDHHSKQRAGAVLPRTGTAHVRPLGPAPVHLQRAPRSVLTRLWTG